MLPVRRRHAVYNVADWPPDLSRHNHQLRTGHRYQSLWPRKSSPCGLCYWTRACGSIPLARVAKAPWAAPALGVQEVKAWLRRVQVRQVSRAVPKVDAGPTPIAASGGGTGSPGEAT